VLTIGDVPNSPARDLEDDVEYPTDERFTLQLLVGDQRALTDLPWIGRDVAFKKGTNLAKPSGLLLDHKYGAAAVKRWGCQTYHHFATSRSLHPSTTVTHRPAGPPRDQTKTTRKRQRQADTAGGNKRRRGRTQKRICGPEKRDQDDSHAGNVVVEAIDGSAGWDEDDWMMFFCLNTNAARGRQRVAGLLTRNSRLVSTSGPAKFHMVESLSSTSFVFDLPGLLPIHFIP
jgi:hypothetical protein